eukprot:6213306-Pleurochrysis_carterae.AAC.2
MAKFREKYNNCGQRHRCRRHGWSSSSSSSLLSSSVRADSVQGVGAQLIASALKLVGEGGGLVTVHSMNARRVTRRVTQ